MAQGVVRRHFALHRGDVGEARAVNEVADAVDAGQVRLHALVDTHAPAIKVQPLLDQVFQAGRVGLAADCHQHVLAGEGLLALLTAGRHLLLLTLIGDRLDLRVGDDGDAALAQDAHEQLAHLLVDGGEDVGQHFHDGDSGAEGVEHAGQLEADDAAAHADNALRHLLQVPAGVAVDDVAAIDAGPGGHERHGAGGEDDLVRAELLLRAVVFRDGDGVVGVDGSLAVEDIDVIALHENAHAAGHALDHFVLEGDDFAHVDFRLLAENDAQFLRRFERVDQFGDMQHRL